MSGGDLNDFLRDRDRVLKAGCALPNEGELSEDGRLRAMENFQRYLQRTKLSVNDVVQKVGSPRASTIRDLMKGVYRENADQHIRTLNNWVEQDARQRAVAISGKYVQTSVAKQMMAAARLVREAGTMGIVYGPTGIGKTRCARAVHEHFAGSILVTVQYGLYHPKGFTTALAEALGVRSVGTARNDAKFSTQYERVIERLRESNRLLIVDEAHKLHEGAIELLREIHDATGVPVLLVAIKELQTRLMRHADPDAGQLYSRIDIECPLVEADAGRDGSKRGMKKLYTVEDIRQLYQDPPIRLGPDAVQYLADVANHLGFGSLRKCKRLLVAAARFARKRQDVPDGDDVTVSAVDLEFAERSLRRSGVEQENVTARQSQAVATA